MSNVLTITVLFIIALAMIDLWVGVSNDAVNFLNSAVGARVASRRTILFIASLGVLFGALFSSGMMEVARKGVFNPDVFMLDGQLQIGAVLALYLGVMAADVVMLDLFNTLGLPTSTTVSIVSELVGASIAVTLWMSGGDISAALGVINTGPVASIYVGIFLSVLVAFSAGALVMFLLRVMFTHDISRGFARWGWLWTGVSFAALSYFVMFKGFKHASFIDADLKQTIQTYVWPAMGVIALISGGLGYVLRNKHKTVFGVIILVGTFGLAVAFAGNDLVNFIGPAVAAAQAVFVEGIKLSGKVPTPSWALALAGAMMVFALWTSKKAKTVSDTEIRLAGGGGHKQSFQAHALGRAVVNIARPLKALAIRLLPASLSRSISRRVDPVNVSPDAPPYDLLRASVNLIVSAAIISVGTANKLPLSTTYITFMVAMGASLADGSWSKGTAASRVSGMITVLSGWLLTGVIAATGAFVMASIVFLVGKTPAGPLIGLVAVAGLVAHSLLRSASAHRRRTAGTPTVLDEV